jgi:hypothetical protein
LPLHVPICRKVNLAALRYASQIRGGRFAPHTGGPLNSPSPTILGAPMR